MSTILVYPFLDDTGLNKYRTIFEGWEELQKKGDALSSKADIFLTPADTGHQASLTSAFQGSTVCIFGHCAPGKNYLRSQTSYDAKETNEAPGKTINTVTLVGLLKRLGLNDNVHTRIKCMNCSSGMNDSDGVYFDEAAFASRLKKACNENLLGNIKVFGYMGELIHLAAPSFGQYHVPHKTFAVLNTTEGQKAFQGRDLRIEMTGNEAQDKMRANQLRAAILNHRGQTDIELHPRW